MTSTVVFIFVVVIIVGGWTLIVKYKVSRKGWIKRLHSSVFTKDGQRVYFCDLGSSHGIHGFQ